MGSLTSGLSRFWFVWQRHYSCLCRSVLLKDASTGRSNRHPTTRTPRVAGTPAPVPHEFGHFRRQLANRRIFSYVHESGLHQTERPPGPTVMRIHVRWRMMLRNLAKEPALFL